MNFRISTLVICLLLAVIGMSLACSCLRLKEGLEMVKSWKSNGSVGWKDAYNVSPGEVEPSGMSFLSNSEASPECCKTNSSFSTADGCVCISKEQYTFLKQRGGNHTIDDGF
jgi:hypothetical protein